MAPRTLRAAALRYRACGLCVLPARADRKCPTVGRWGPYQRQLPTLEEVTAWFDGLQSGLCLVCGGVSGNLEMLDFDLGGEAFQAWYELVQTRNAPLLARLVIEQSPSGGWHVVYRCHEPVSGNLKLAQRKQIVVGPDEVTIAGKTYKPRCDADGQWYVLLTLIETRGEGGLFLCSPTPGYELLQGDLAELPTLTEAERDGLLDAAWALNEDAETEASCQIGKMREAGNERCSSSDPSLAADRAPDTRPGDDFNERGDLRAVLRRHGWTLAKAGENEYWRRPGKTSGSSATLKDGVFYVFSSNAAPFEPNRPYSPFGVYALLEHGGNFVAAAAALRAAGFGSTGDTADDVDLSRLMPCRDAEETPIEQETIDPGPIPEELLRVPGFVSEVMDFCLSAARYPSVPLAFCGAMALQSFLASRRVREEGGLRPNLYVLALAGSGTGKAYPRKINSYILGRIGLGAAVGNQIASGQGLEDEMLVHRKMLFQTDEIDHLLRCIASPKESYYSMLLAMLLQLYTEADEIHTVRTKVRDRGRKSEPRGEIDQPGLVIFGTATPECFFEALSPRLLTNGLFSRAIVVDAEERGRKQQARDVSQLPQRLLDIATWWRDYNPGPVNPITGRRPNLDDEHPTPAVVPYSETGFAALDRFAARADDEYDAATRAGDRVRAVVWTRAGENATRLALVYACSRNHLDPCIDEEAAQWAVAFVGHLIRRMLFLAAQHVAENPFHAECLKLLRKLRAAGGQLSRRELMRLLRAKAAEFDQVVGTLVQQGELLPTEIPTRTKPALGYRLP